MSGGESNGQALQGNAYSTGHSKKSQGYRQIEQHRRKCMYAIRHPKPQKRKYRSLPPVSDTSPPPTPPWNGGK